MRCPVCETENSEDAAECANCGKALSVEADLVEEVAPLPGLELTLQEPVQAQVDLMSELEQTQLAPPDLLAWLHAPGGRH